MFSALSVPWWGAAWWTLGIALKSAALLVLVQLAATALHRSSAGLRHLVWAGGVVAVLTLPLVSLGLPWQLPVVSVPPPAAAPGAAAAVEQEGPGLAPGAAGEAAHSSRERSAAPSRGMLVPWLFAAWGAGAVFFLAGLGLGAVSLRRVVRRATPLDSPDWTHPLIDGADRLGLARLPRLLISDSVAMPVVCGILDPAIVVPADAREWVDRRRRAVLCHELAHLRRLDLPVNLLGRLACALHWFNPLVWHAVRRLRAESERACDDLVLGVGTRPSEYADHLLQIVCGAKRERAPAVSIPMAQRREFEGRMLAILEKDAQRGAPSRFHAAGLAALALLLLLPLAAMGPVPAASEGASASPSGQPLSRPEGGSPEPSVLTALLSALEAPDADQRRDAADALGTFEARAAVGPLGSHLHRDLDPGVRETAAWALARIGGPDAVDELSAAAVRDTSEAVRGMAVWALGQIADPAALSKLEIALGDASAQVRAGAAWAVGTIGPPRAPARLIEALGDADDHVREFAAWAVGQIRDPAAVPALTALLRDSTSKAGYEAVWALARIGGDAARRPLTEATHRHFVAADFDLQQAIETALAGRHVASRPRTWHLPSLR